MVFLTKKELNEINETLHKQGIRKYLYAGALNPEWVHFHEIMYKEKQAEKEREMELTTNNNYATTSEAIPIIDAMINEYEAKLEFLKRHENNPDDYAKAKSILGL